MENATATLAIFIADMRSKRGMLLDSKAAINLAQDPVAFKKTKHILRAAHELRDRVHRGLFTMQYVEAANQLADIMTKGLRVHLHKSMNKRLLWTEDSNDCPSDVRDASSDEVS